MPADPGQPGTRVLLQGDEGAVFEEHHERLRRVTRLEVNTSADNVEEACAFAWSQLLRHQPQRETVFAWLRQVARREAIRLDKISRSTVSLDADDTAHVPEPAASRARTEVAHRLIEAQERLAVLPQRDRAVAFMRAAGWRYSEIGQSLGISDTRVNQLLVRADRRLRELEGRDQIARSPRAARLRELEADPPPFLLGALGPPPRPSRKTGGAQRQLEWRRLALAIEDYRDAHGITDPLKALGPSTPSQMGSYDRRSLEGQIALFSERRQVAREPGLGGRV